MLSGITTRVLIQKGWLPVEPVGDFWGSCLAEAREQGVLRVLPLRHVRGMGSTNVVVSLTCPGP